MDKILLATRNKGKVRELRELFNPMGIEVLSIDAFPTAPEVEEDGETFEANAIKKAETISKAFHIPALSR